MAIIDYNIRPLMDQGKITLERPFKSFVAGFCILKAELPDLIKQCALLHDDELEYYKNLIFDRRKASYLLGRIAAKKAIGELIGEEHIHSVFIDMGIFQFPVVKMIAGLNIQVSISHCDDIGVALAFPEEHPLGIDIEKIDLGRLDAMKSMISNDELILLSGCDLSLPTGCTIIWSVKESLSKILRTGFTMDSKLMEIQSIEKSGMQYNCTFRNFSQYKAISGQSGNYVYSIVLPKNTTAGLVDFLESFKEGGKW